MLRTTLGTLLAHVPNAAEVNNQTKTENNMTTINAKGKQLLGLLATNHGAIHTETNPPKGSNYVSVSLPVEELNKIAEGMGCLAELIAMSSEQGHLGDGT